MKKALCAFLALALLLSGCGAPDASASGSTAPDPTEQPTAAPETGSPAAEQILRAMLSACPEDVSAGLPIPADDLPLLVEHYYGLSEEHWEDAAILQAGGASAFELAAVRLAEGADLDEARQGMQAYILSRQGDFTGYAPDQAALCADGMVMAHGRWLALAIIGYNSRVLNEFDCCFSDGADTFGWTGQQEIEINRPGSTARFPYTDPQTDDMTLYDTGAILDAWRSDDRSALSEKDAAILQAAEGVLEEMLTDGMSDYEKEAALYLWVVYHVDYDWDHEDPSPFVKMDPDSPDPYGALINRRAICLGFATTFQLLMDLAGVECITVVGAAFQSTESHAWNMVRLNGAWYCVDPTWDIGTVWFDFEAGTAIDPMDAWERGEFEPRWGYFNVTSDHMAETDHQWDYSAVPEATARDGGQP